MNYSLIIMIALSLATVGVIYFLVPFLIKKGVPVDTILNSAEQISKISDTILQSLNLEGKNANLVTSIEKIAAMAVRYSEQLYVSGKLPKEQRKDASVEFVKNALTESGIQVTDSNTALINDIIEAAVFLLPKTDEAKAVAMAKQNS